MKSPPEFYDKICRMRQLGMTWTGISRELGLSIAKVQEIGQFRPDGWARADGLRSVLSREIKRDVTLRSQRKAYRRRYSKQYHLDNRDEHLAAMRVYYQQNKERLAKRRSSKSHQELKSQ